MKAIFPGVILTIDIHAFRNITFVVTDLDGTIIALSAIDKLFLPGYNVRKRCVETADILIKNHHVDTIIMEDNQLFIDKIDRFPDPYVMRNIVLGFGIKTAIEDRYLESMRYIFEFPEHDWRTKILNPAVKYSIDLYKAHVKQREDLSEDFMKIIDDGNYYRAICLSESARYSSLMKEKYLVDYNE